MWRPLLQYLSKAISATVTLQIVEEYHELALRMQNGQFDIAVFPPFSYINAKDKMPQLDYAATLIKSYADGRISAHYNGVLIALKSEKTNNLGDLKHKRFAFTSKSSTSGYLYPSALLKQQKIHPSSYFSQIFMLKKHSKMVSALLSKAIDVGATTDEALYRAQQQYGDIFSIIAQTADIPFDAIALANHLPKPLREKIKHKLLTAYQQPQLRRALTVSRWKYSGFIKKNDAFYNRVRIVRDTLESPNLP
jgi:phosphate/phosphite/phosphonate ABC transporter binding protein